MFKLYQDCHYYICIDGMIKETVHEIAEKYNQIPRKIVTDLFDKSKCLRVIFKYTSKGIVTYINMNTFDINPNKEVCFELGTDEYYILDEIIQTLPILKQFIIKPFATEETKTSFDPNVVYKLDKKTASDYTRRMGYRGDLYKALLNGFVVRDDRIWYKSLTGVSKVVHDCSSFITQHLYISATGGDTVDQLIKERADVRYENNKYAKSKMKFEKFVETAKELRELGINVTLYTRTNNKCTEHELNADVINRLYIDKKDHIVSLWNAEINQSMAELKDKIERLNKLGNSYSIGDFI